MGVDGGVVARVAERKVENEEHMRGRAGRPARPKQAARVDSAVDKLRKSKDMRSGDVVRSSKEADEHEAELVRRAMKSEQAARIERELRRPAYDANWLFMDEGEINGSGAAEENGS